MNKIRIGIIGIGNMGTGHIRNITEGKMPDYEIGAVCDTNPSALERIAKTTSAPQFSDAIAMMDSGLLDAVLIATPHYDHPQIAIEAMKRKLHVMSEKPAGVFTKQVQQMNDFAKTAGVKFGIMFQTRTIDQFKQMKAIVDSGEMGNMKRMSWIVTDWYRAQCYYDSGDWRATWSGEGGGVLLNQCPHNLDVLQWICGMPKLVDAKLHFGKWHDIEVEDDVSAYFEYENGATGTFVTTTADAPGTNRFEIVFENGKLLAENGKLFKYKNEVNEREWCRTTNRGYSAPPCEMTEIELNTTSLLHSEVMNAFADAILRGGEMIADGSEGIRGLTLSNAMHLSAFLGRAVEIPFDDTLYYEELSKRIATSRRKTGGVAMFHDIGNTYYM